MHYAAGTSVYLASALRGPLGPAPDPSRGRSCVSLCASQGVPLSARKTSEKAAAAGNTAEGHAALLQLPHFSETVIKKLQRKVCLAAHLWCESGP